MADEDMGLIRVILSQVLIYHLLERRTEGRAGWTNKEMSF